MNYSRATTPIPANKPGVDKRIDDKMEILLEQQKALEEALQHYKKKIALNDWWKEWYENALTSYEKKYEKLMREIENTSGIAHGEAKNESTKGTETTTEMAPTGTHPTAGKKEGTQGKKP